MVFDPKKYLIKVQGGKQYLPVSARLIWFREVHPDWGIDTHLLTLDIERQYAVFEAAVYNADGKLMARGTKMEDVRGFPDYVEKAETGAIGRALAVCGFGTQFAPELDETGAGRFVDSPQGAEAPARNESSRYNSRYNRASDTRNGGGANRNGSGDYSQRRDADREQPREPARETAAQRPSAPAATQTAEPAARTTVATDAVNGSETACSACGRELTHGQAVLSIGKFGVALCPTCQKERRAADA